MSRTEAIKALSSTDGFFRHWMPYSQRIALTQALSGEEGNYFATLLTELKARIEAMPKTYETEDTPMKDKVIHLHYFRGGIDAWIVEKDIGDGTEDLRQLQAFGLQSFSGLPEAEWGYISIAELISYEVELDLYWTPKTVKELSWVASSSQCWRSMLI